MGLPAIIRKPSPLLAVLSIECLVQIWGEGAAYRSESRRIRAASIRRHVIDRDASVFGLRFSIEANEASFLRYKLVRAIFRRSEVQARGPVVAEVFGVSAGRAIGSSGWVHGFGVHLPVDQ